MNQDELNNEIAGLEKVVELLPDDQGDTLRENIETAKDALEQDNIAKASKDIQAVKGQLEQVIASMRGDIPPELAAALQEVGQQMPTTGASAQIASDVAAKASTVANAVEGQQLQEQLGGMIGSIVGVKMLAEVPALANEESLMAFKNFAGHVDLNIQNMSGAALFNKTHSGVNQNDTPQGQGQAPVV